MTHPAVSQQIQSLEKELNVKLFRRTTRSVKLTEEGKIFLNDARQIVAVSERAKKRFDGAAPRLIETVSLGFYNSPCMFLMSGTLERLRAQRPELHPRLQVIPFQHCLPDAGGGRSGRSGGAQGSVRHQNFRTV